MEKVCKSNITRKKSHSGQMQPYTVYNGDSVAIETH